MQNYHSLLDIREINSPSDTQVEFKFASDSLLLGAAQADEDDKSLFLFLFVLVFDA
jgi:hypothetical protein